MVDEIITGISRAINAEFNTGGDTYAIYAEKVEQGLSVPCFIIDIAGVSRSPYLNMRHKRAHEFDVVFIPETGTRSEMLAAADRLFSALECVALPDGTGLFGYDMRYEIVDDVLHFFVRYPVVVNTVTDAAVMRAVDVSVEC